MSLRHTSTSELELFVQMARTFPVRTLIFSFGLPLFALLQVVNGVVNQGPIAVIGLFALVTMVFSVSLTRYQVAVFHRRSVTGEVPTADTMS